jgi:hypothetical protein
MAIATASPAFLVQPVDFTGAGSRACHDVKRALHALQCGQSPLSSCSPGPLHSPPAPTLATAIAPRKAMRLEE